MPPLPSPLARGPSWQLDDTTLQRLAQELARDVYSVEEVLARYSIDAYVFKERIRPNPVFIKFFSEAHTVWHASGNTTERIQLKAAATFEDWLAEADHLFHDRNQSLPGKVELMKTIGRVAGLDREKDRGVVAPGERVHVQIILNAASVEPKTIVIDKIAPPAIDLTPQ